MADYEQFGVQNAIDLSDMVKSYLNTLLTGREEVIRAEFDNGRFEFHLQAVTQIISGYLETHSGIDDDEFEDEMRNFVHGVGFTLGRFSSSFIRFVTNNLKQLISRAAEVNYIASPFPNVNMNVSDSDDELSD